MAEYQPPKVVRIVWFSGTGCTELVAGKLADQLSQRGVEVHSESLCIQQAPSRLIQEDMLIVLYPVYALNAPGIVYHYIQDLECASGLPAVVLSVSGGGEVFPNRACRKHVIRLLEQHSFRVVYERMLVMPSNTLTETPIDTAVTLLRILPKKLDRIVGALLNGVVRRTKPSPIDSILSRFGEIEKYGAKRMGKQIIVAPSCGGCGRCWESCPTGNITNVDGRPVFGFKCNNCMKCIYACPRKALAMKHGKTLVLKNGFSLTDIQNAAESGTMVLNGNQLKGTMWSGIKAYLEETD